MRPWPIRLTGSQAEFAGRGAPRWLDGVSEADCYPLDSPTVARISKSESADSRVAPCRCAQAAISTSIAGTVTPRARARRATSYATFQTSSSIGSSGSELAKSRRTCCSCCPRAPFQSSSCTSGHQQACPAVSAATTRARTVGSPEGRSMCIQDDVSMRINRSILSSHGVELLWRDQVGAGTGIPCEFCHAHATVEVRDGTDDGFPFGFRPRELDGIFKFTVGNIDSSFHIPTIAFVGSDAQSLNIPNSCYPASQYGHIGIILLWHTLHWDTALASA